MNDDGIQNIQERIATAVVLGRAGSKGLPGKHVRLVAGVPMIARSVGHALAARSVGRVLCSTDGEAIASAAAAVGAEIVDRPDSLADDLATVDSAVRQAIEAAKDTSDIVVILYGNIPVRPAGLIDRAVTRLIETDADSVQSYAPVGKHHPFWTCRVEPIMFMQTMPAAWSLSTAHLGGTPTAETKTLAPEPQTMSMSSGSLPPV